MTTQEQYQQLANALQELSARCDGAKEQDGVGFNGIDTKAGKAAAAMSTVGTLATFDQVYLIEMVQKYRKQIEPMPLPTVKEYGDGYSDGTGASAREAYAKTGEKALITRDTEVVISPMGQAIAVGFSGERFHEHKDLLKSKVPARDRRFDGLSRLWVIDLKWAKVVVGLYPGAFVHPTVSAAITAMGERMPEKAPRQPKPMMIVNLNGQRVEMRTPFYRKDWHEACKACGSWFADKKGGGKDKHWYAAASKAHRVVVTLAAYDDIEISPAVLELAERQAELEQLSRASDAELEIDLQFPAGLELLPYQKAGVQFLLNKDGRAIVGDDMGLGKTIQAIAYLQANKEARPALIVCPATVKVNWQRECEKWLTHGKRIELLSGRKASKLTKGAADIYIINYDILNHSGKGLTWKDALLDVGIKVAIFDEAHRVSNSKSLRGQAAKEISKEIEHVIFLTGTPMQNRPKELWPLLNMVDDLAWPSFYKYGIEYCNGHKNGYGWDFSGASNLGKLFEETKPYMVRRKKVDVLTDLPEKRRVDIVVELSKKHLTEYRRTRAALEQAIMRGDGGGAAHLNMIAKLKQLTAKQKMGFALDWVGDFLDGDNKLIIFAWHKAIIKQVQEHLDKLGVGHTSITGDTPAAKRDEAREQFQTDPKCRVIVGNIQAMGEGVTLTAASDVLFLEFGWKPGEHTQAEDRAHRIGQRDSVTAWYIIAKETLDVTLFNVIDGKRTIVEAAIDGNEWKHESAAVLIDEASKRELAEGELTDLLVLNTFTSSDVGVLVHNAILDAVGIFA